MWIQRPMTGASLLSGTRERHLSYCPWIASSNTNNAMAESKGSKIGLALWVDGHILAPLWITATCQSWASVSSCMQKRADRPFPCVFYSFLWHSMSSTLKRCSWLASHVSKESRIDFHLPQMVAVMWKGTAGGWELVGDQIGGAQIQQ